MTAGLGPNALEGDIQENEQKCYVCLTLTTPKWHKDHMHTTELSVPLAVSEAWIR